MCGGCLRGARSGGWQQHWPQGRWGERLDSTRNINHRRTCRWPVSRRSGGRRDGRRDRGQVPAPLQWLEFPIASRREEGRGRSSTDNSYFITTRVRGSTGGGLGAGCMQPMAGGETTKRMLQRPLKYNAYPCTPLSIAMTCMLNWSNGKPRGSPHSRRGLGPCFNACMHMCTRAWV